LWDYQAPLSFFPDAGPPACLLLYEVLRPGQSSTHKV
jgi:hypothetical protein